MNDQNLKKIITPGRIKRIGVDINRSCDVKCIMCPMHNESQGKITISKMKLDDFKNMVKSFRVLTIDQINFAGSGEAILHPDFSEMLTLIKSYGKICIEVTTNGNSLMPRLVDKIYNYVDIYTISVHAATEETYKKIVVHGKFSELCQNIQYLRQKSDKRVRLVFVGMKNNIHEFPAFVELADRLNVREIRLNNFVEIGHERVKDQSLVRYPEILREYVGRAIQKGREKNIDIDVLEPYKAIILNRQTDFKIEKNLNNISDSYPIELPDGFTLDCVAPFLGLFVRLNGEVIPCCMPNFKPLANINSESLKQIWLKKFSELRFGLLTGKLKYDCQVCKRQPKIKIEDFRNKISNLLEGDCVGTPVAMNQNDLVTVFKRKIIGGIRNLLCA